MKHSFRYAASAVLVVALLMLMSCVTEEESPYMTNLAPRVYSMVYTSPQHDSLHGTDTTDIVFSGDTVLIRVNADDPEGDALRYRWSAHYGGLIDTLDVVVRWVAPDVASARVDSIRCIVSDRWHSTEKVRGIRILPKGFFNVAPHIQNIAVARDTLFWGDSTSLVVTVVDPDDPLSSLWYEWASTGGTLRADSSHNTATWVAPNTPEMGVVTYWIYVAVNDRYKSHNDSVKIVVGTRALVNRPPQILSLTADPDTVETGMYLSAYCEADDPDGQIASLRYTWSAPGATITGNGPQADITAPSDTGRFYVSVVVSDSFSTVRDSIRILVVPYGTVNHPPEIERIYASPQSVAIRDTSMLTCNAIDPNGTPLTYNWNASGGRLLSTTGNVVRWIAPGITGNYPINCTVSDGELTAFASTTVRVVPDSFILYQSDFATNEVRNRWDTYGGLLAGLGTSYINHQVYWDSVGLRLAIIGHSNYGTLAFPLQGATPFGDGTFSVNVEATSTQFGCIGFLPKYINQQNYILIRLNLFQQYWQIVSCVNGVLTYHMENPGAQLFANTLYNIRFNKVDNDVTVHLNNTQIWSGAVNNAFNTPCTMGMAVFGISDSGPAYFDDVLVTNP